MGDSSLESQVELTDHPAMEDAALPKLKTETFGNDNSNLWLVKVPAALGRKWMECANTGKKVGDVSIINTPARYPGQKATQGMVYTAASDLVGEPEAKVPRTGNQPGMMGNGAYGRQGAPNSGPMALGRTAPKSLGISMERNFSMKQLDTRGSQNNALQVVITETKRNPPTLQDETRELRGKISKFYELAPKKSLDYFKWKKARNEILSQPKKVVVRTNATTTENRYLASNVQNSVKKSEKPTNSKAPRVQMDDDEVQDRIFGLFAQHEFYQLDDIQKELNQPREKVVRVLSKIGRKSADRRNHWELIDEFKHY